MIETDGERQTRRKDDDGTGHREYWADAALQAFDDGPDGIGRDLADAILACGLNPDGSRCIPSARTVETLTALGLSDPWRELRAGDRSRALAILRDGARLFPGVVDTTLGTPRRLPPDDGRPGPFEPADLEAIPADPPKRRWLVDGLAPFGRLSSLHGHGEVGKTRLVLQIAVAVARGSGPMLPWDPEATGPTDLKARGDVPCIGLGRPGRVLILSWEDEVEEFGRRLNLARAAGAVDPGEPDPEAVRVVNMRRIGGPLWAPSAAGSGHVSTRGEWTPAGRRLLDTLPQFDMAVIDPQAAAFACSEIDRGLVRAFTSALDNEGEQAECAVWLVAHPPKSNEDYSGSTDWRNATRGMMTLKRTPSGHYLAPTDPTEKAGEMIEAWHVDRAKSNYGPPSGGVWLRSQWTAAEGDNPPKLAWWATTAARAAAAVAGGEVTNKKPEKPRPKAAKADKPKGKPLDSNLTTIK